MNTELQLKLQAWLDGELPAGEAAEIARLVERDVEARALVAELRNTHAAMEAFESTLTVPESREFHWSKIRREIERVEQKPEAVTVSWIERLRRMLIPASAIAAVGLVVLFTLSPAGTRGGLEVQNLVADSDTFTYVDEENGTTFIWFAYPSENEFAEPDDVDNI